MKYDYYLLIVSYNKQNVFIGYKFATIQKLYSIKESRVTIFIARVALQFIYVIRNKQVKIDPNEHPRILLAIDK